MARAGDALLSQFAFVIGDRAVGDFSKSMAKAVSYTHLRAHETVLDLVCRLLLEKKKNITSETLTHLITLLVTKYNKSLITTSST